jgi:hypothetical protein
VIVIKAKDSSWDPQLIGKLIDGYLEIHEVSGSHDEIQSELRGKAWAKILKRSLSEAQAKVL